MSDTDWIDYDRIAEGYELAVAPLMMGAARDLAAAIEAPFHSTVLDLGTGTGAAAVALLGAVGPEGRVVGVDRSPAMLARAHAAHPDFHAIVGDAHDLPFPASTFQGVTANFVLSHLIDVGRALGEVRRVLVPGATFAASAWRRDEDELTRTWKEAVAKAIGAERMEAATRLALPADEMLTVPSRFQETLEQAGFEAVRVEWRLYRSRRSIEDYLWSREVLALGRYARKVLDDQGWTALRRDALAAFHLRFSEPVTSEREALIAVGQAPA